MDQTASDFFGMDFGAAPVATQAAPPPGNEAPKTVAQSALEFFGLDFAAKPPPPPPQVITKKQNLPDRFEQVFSRLKTQESGNKHTTADGKLITSASGAQGITQVMPASAANPGYGIAPIKDHSQAEYERFGRDYLKVMLQEFGGDYEKALAAYNAGVGNVKKAITKGGENWKDHLPKKSETIPYINNILGKR